MTMNESKERGVMHLMIDKIKCVGWAYWITASFIFGLGLLPVLAALIHGSPSVAYLGAAPFSVVVLMVLLALLTSHDGHEYFRQAQDHE